MITTVVLGAALALGAVGQTSAPGLPDTPQGRQVAAYIKAFNSGDEKVFLDAQEQLLTKTHLARRDREERARMYRRMRGDFGTITIGKIVKASALTIHITVPLQEGGDAQMIFDLDEAPPYKISAIGVDAQIQRRGND